MSNLNTSIFRALRYRNFRLFFFGQGVSLVGTWMQQIAMSWFVYRLTGSVLLLGIVGFSNQIPHFALSPFAGVLTDRWDRRRILIITQTLSMAQAFILAYLTLAGTVKVWHVITLGIMLGCVNSLDTPTRQAFIIDMIEGKAALGNAIALNSLMFNLARLIGPSIAGILIALVGEGICFFINGVTFLAVIASLFAMRIAVRKTGRQNGHILSELKEGVRYTFGFAPIRMIILLVGVISVMGMSYVLLMPIFAKDILAGGPHTLGFLMASVGIGACLGTLYLASKKEFGLGRIIPISSALFGAGLIAFSLSRVLWLSFSFLLVIGFGFMVEMASCNTALQTIVDDDKRGRVMSFFTMAFLGMAPVGSLIAGALASRIGAPNTLMIGGVSCIAASIAFWIRLPLLSSRWKGRS